MPIHTRMGKKWTKGTQWKSSAVGSVSWISFLRVMVQRFAMYNVQISIITIEILTATYNVFFLQNINNKSITFAFVYATYSSPVIL